MWYSTFQNHRTAFLDTFLAILIFNEQVSLLFNFLLTLFPSKFKQNHKIIYSFGLLTTFAIFSPKRKFSAINSHKAENEKKELFPTVNFSFFIQPFFPNPLCFWYHKNRVKLIFFFVKLHEVEKFIDCFPVNEKEN